MQVTPYQSPNDSAEPANLFEPGNSFNDGFAIKLSGFVFSLAFDLVVRKRFCTAV